MVYFGNIRLAGVSLLIELIHIEANSAFDSCIVLDQSLQLHAHVLPARNSRQ